MSIVSPKEFSEDVQKNIASQVQSLSDTLNINNKIDLVTAQNLLQKNLLTYPAFKNSTEQGKALEAVVDYFLKNCGLFMHVEHDTRNRVHQLDHTATFSMHISPFLKSIFDLSLHRILGESKNYIKNSKKIDVDIVYKVEGIKLLTGIGLSIYFSRGDLTGDDLTAAVGLAGIFCDHRGADSKTIAIHFCDDDWVYLNENPRNFSKLLFTKIDRFKNHRDFSIDRKLVESYGA